MFIDMANALFKVPMSKAEQDTRIYWNRQSEAAVASGVLQRQIDDLKRRIEALEGT